MNNRSLQSSRGRVVVVLGLPAATISTASSKSGVTSEVGEIVLVVLISAGFIGSLVGSAVVEESKDSVDGPKEKIVLYFISTKKKF